MANNAIQIFDGTPTEVITETTANLADADYMGGDLVFDNTTDLWPLAVATLFVTGFGADPSGGTVDLYLMKGDMGAGTENEDAGSTAYGASVTATSASALGKGLHYVGSFQFDADSGGTGNQRKAITISLAGIKEAYFYIDNQTGTTLTQPVTVDVEGFTYTPSA